MRYAYKTFKIKGHDFYIEKSRRVYSIGFGINFVHIRNSDAFRRSIQVSRGIELVFWRWAICFSFVKHSDLF